MRAPLRHTLHPLEIPAPWRHRLHRGNLVSDRHPEIETDHGKHLCLMGMLSYERSVEAFGDAVSADCPRLSRSIIHGGGVLCRGAACCDKAFLRLLALCSTAVIGMQAVTCQVDFWVTQAFALPPLVHSDHASKDAMACPSQACTYNNVSALRCSPQEPICKPARNRRCFTISACAESGGPNT